MTNQSNSSAVLNQQPLDSTVISDCCICATLKDGRKIIQQLAPVRKAIVMDPAGRVLLECESLSDVQELLPGVSSQLFGLCQQNLKSGQDTLSEPEPLGALCVSNAEDTTCQRRNITVSDQFGFSSYVVSPEDDHFQTDAGYVEDTERSLSLTDEVSEFARTEEGHEYFIQATPVSPATPVHDGSSSDEHEYFQPATPVSQVYSRDSDAEMEEEEGEKEEVAMEPYERFRSGNFRSSVTEEERSLHDEFDFLTCETWLSDTIKDG